MMRDKPRSSFDQKHVQPSTMRKLRLSDGDRRNGTSSSQITTKSSHKFAWKLSLCLIVLSLYSMGQHVRIHGVKQILPVQFDSNRSLLKESLSSDEEAAAKKTLQAWSEAGMPIHMATRKVVAAAAAAASTTVNYTFMDLQIDPAVPQKSQFAYAFLLGGVMSDSSHSWRGGFYGAVVAAHALRQRGSQADVVFLVQISAKAPKHATLPQVETRLLRALDIRLFHLPRFAHPRLETFYSLMLEKFRILQLDSYKRILYLDNDILPYCNMDYLMELSAEASSSSSEQRPPHYLQENVVLSYKTEPSSGGFFILKPNATDYQRLVQIILKKEKKGLQLPYPHWDVVEGWGHVMAQDDQWMTTLGETGTNWTWHGANADQGLLLYWTKYVQQKVSIIRKRQVDRWVPGKAHQQRQPVLQNSDASNYLHDKSSCQHPPAQVRQNRYVSPYSNFVHLTGRSKPWHANLTELERAMVDKKDRPEVMDNNELWFMLLKDALQHAGMETQADLDFITNVPHEPAVGRAPSFVQMANYLQFRAKNGWKQYEYQFDEENRAAVAPKQYRNVTTTNAFVKTNAMPSVSTAPIDIVDEEWVKERKYAYAFLLGGARSENTKKSDYRGGLYSVVVAAHLFRKHGSTADVILMVQISAETSYRKLPDLEEEILKLAGVKVVYIPKFGSPKFEKFYSLMMEKFRILSMTEYARVIYLDYDVMPRCNMDYLFHLSDPSPSQISKDPNRFRLKESVGVAFKADPANGGIFMLTPSAEDFQHIQRVIHEKELHALELPFPHWNETLGWGHVIQPPDYWRSMWGRNGTTWSWYGSIADQGLIYYWMKYVKKSVSFIVKHEVEQWYTTQDGSLQREDEFYPNVLNQFGCVSKSVRRRKSVGPSPHSDFVHLTGRSKPWNTKLEDLQQAIQEKSFKDCNDKEKWFFTLMEALTEMNMLDRVSFSFITPSDELPPVGVAPSYQQMAKYLYDKKKNGWKQYEYEVDEPDVIKELTSKEDDW